MISDREVHLGYDDDVDMGEGFTFTGAGGRDLKGTKANPKNVW
jgi:E3 ubiquitin-protein ligase UHRF1